MIFASKSAVEQKLSEVKVPVLALTGSKDPDFANPGDELKWIESVLQSETTLIEGAGHYPHLEFPKHIAELIQSFVLKTQAHVSPTSSKN